MLSKLELSEARARSKLAMFTMQEAEREAEREKRIIEGARTDKARHDAKKEI